MSWIQKLYETYEQCYGAPQFASNPLLPISHITQQAHIEISIDANGNFRRALIVGKIDTIMPASAKSAARTTNEEPHPLCEKIQYCAADYPKFHGKKNSYFTSYEKQLANWCESSASHPKAIAILRYVRKATTVADLVREKILSIGADGHLLTAPKPDLPTSELFKYLTAKEGERDQGDALIRWRVETPGEPVSETWMDEALMKAWINFDSVQNQEHGFCMVSGEVVTLAQSHPKRLRHAGDGARLISSNDSSGYTFRGRFIDASQACGVSIVVTQKAHNALRWLIQRQRFRNGDQTIVAWAVSGKSLPDPFANSAEMFGIEAEQEAISAPYSGDAGQSFAVRLNKRLAGYRASLGSDEGIVVMAVDSATPGRLAIIYYREMTGSEFLERLESWHADHAWHQNLDRNLRFIGAPSPDDIAEAAYGRRIDDKLRKATKERLLPCIVDGQNVPRDLLDSVVRRTTNRISLKRYEFEKYLGIACALFKGVFKEGNYQMALESNRTSRDYLYGRLLAIAESIEGRALYLAGETRETNAAKLMQRFADRPYSTWKTIELSLSPSKTRLRAKRPGFLHEMEKELDDVSCLFKEGDFMDERQLSGEFLLGYHCERQALRPKTESEPTVETIENTNA